MMDGFRQSRWAISSNRSTSVADAIDDVQVKKRALYYLCRINANWEEVEKFLIRYPQALLFESPNADARVQALVAAQMKQCSCFSPACNENRQVTLMVLRRGFEYYRAFAYSDCYEEDRFLRRVARGDHWEFYAGELKVLEQEIRDMKEKKQLIGNHLEKVKSDIHDFQLEIEDAVEKDEPCKSTLTLLKCQRNEDTHERRVLLEKHLVQATMIAKSLQVDIEMLVEEQSAAQQLQAAILKTAFAGCNRQMCFATQEVKGYAVA